MVFDNDAWRKTGESVQGGYEEINEEIVRRFGILFGAGEIQQGQEVAESVVDSSEIINTLSGGGVSTVGYAEEEVEERTSGGLLSRLRNDDGEDQLDSAHTTNRITSLVRKAALGRLTLVRSREPSAPCSCLRGRRSTSTGKVSSAGGSGSKSRPARWRSAGDYPYRGAGFVATVILLAGVTNVPRIKELQQVAIEAQDNLDEIRDESEENLDELVSDDSDELESLF